MFYNIDVSNKVLDGMLLKFNTVTSNITNADTPGYKRQEVNFEQALVQEIERNGVKNIEINQLEPTVFTDQSNLSYRLDGNNIDIDTEMVELAKIQLRYNTLIQRTNAQIGRYKYILGNIR